MLTSQQLCKKLGITKKRLDRWRREGLPSAMRKGRRLFDPLAVAKWIEQHGKGKRENQGQGVFEKAAGEAGARTVATTKNEAAQALGVSLRTLGDWLNDASFPGKAGSPGRQDGYFPLAEISAWRVAKLGGDGRSRSDASELSELRARKLGLEIDQLQVEYEKACGSILDAEELAAFLERHIAVVKTVLEQLTDKVETRLPTSLHAKVRAKIRKAVDDTVTEACNTIAETMQDGARNQDDEST